MKMIQHYTLINTENNQDKAVHVPARMYISSIDIRTIMDKFKSFLYRILYVKQQIDPTPIF